MLTSVGTGGIRQGVAVGAVLEHVKLIPQP